MPNINDFKYRTTKELITVPEYGTFWPCNNPNFECGTCSRGWNYNHELPYIKQLREILPKDSVGIDIGAHIGLYSIGLKDKIKKMYSFEPDKYSYEALCYNAGLYKNIIPFNYACGDKATGSSNADVIQLDNFFNNSGIIPNFVKIDVEGQEIKILQGMKNLLLPLKNLVLLIEFEMKHLAIYNYTAEDFFDALTNVGLPCMEFFKKEIKPNLNSNSFTNLIIQKINNQTYIST